MKARRRPNAAGRESPNENYKPEIEEQESTLSLGIPMITQQQQQEQMMVIENDRYIESRSTAIDSIESTIAELGGIFQQLATMVAEQRETVQRIDQNTDDIEMNVMGAQRELLKYYTNISSNRWLIIKIFVTIVFFFMDCEHNVMKRIYFVFLRAWMFSAQKQIPSSGTRAIAKALAKGPTFWIPSSNFILSTQPSFNADIPSEWVRGTDINYRRAQRQAVEIDLSQNFYLYPENGLRFVGNGEFPSDIERYKYITASAFGEREHKPHKLWPQTGTEGFTAAAEASATKISDQDMQTVRIPHQYILFSPAALRPTKEFKEAVQYALEVPLDNKKFLGLQQVFKEFGYYYPYWIATGGDVNLLINGPDIEGWFKSGTTNPDFLVPLDINPIYDLLDDEIRSEVKRVYQTQYAEPISRINPHPGSRGNISMALSRLSKLRHHIGIAKGVQFGGDQSEEDVVELKNNSDISKLMKLTSVGGKPRIECEVHRTILGTDSSTHAFLHNAFSGYAVGSSGFMRSAISSHIERNGGELQPATQGVTYFVMYVTYREVSILWKKESNLSDFLWASGTSNQMDCFP
ncbi:cis-Golgi t-SNARE syntaxin [Apophysomyces sp. BC1034]|nr:cis-Golgi t-SNARE syntaxin [Apophysomyces sp. BC1034]